MALEATIQTINDRSIDGKVDVEVQFEDADVGKIFTKTYTFNDINNLNIEDIKSLVTRDAEKIKAINEAYGKLKLFEGIKITI
jgi:hypothetical protein